MNWRDGLSRKEQIEVELKAKNIEPTDPRALAIAVATWSDYDIAPLSELELELTARDTLADIARERGRA